jgi:outer membrane biosynthesis protein TonB
MFFRNFICIVSIALFLGASNYTYAKEGNRPSKATQKTIKKKEKPKPSKPPKKTKPSKPPKKTKPYSPPKYYKHFRKHHDSNDDKTNGGVKG